MTPHKEDLVFLRGLFNEQAARHPSAHLGRIPNLLSGAWVNTNQNEIRVGETMDLDGGRAAARQVGLAILSTLRSELGNLDRVSRVIKLLGMVNCTPDFPDHPKVINGCSELFAEVWGKDAGVGARSAVGMGPLPGNIAVEIEAIFEISLPEVQDLE